MAATATLITFDSANPAIKTFINKSSIIQKTKKQYYWLHTLPVKVNINIGLRPFLSDHAPTKIHKIHGIINVTRSIVIFI